MNTSALKNVAPPPPPAANGARANVVLRGLVAKRLSKPPRVLVYGQAGVGKSTFAAAAPKPIFVGAEDGTSELAVYRYPKHIETGEDLFEAVDILEREEHDFRSIVIDTVDWAEPLIWDMVCRTAGKAGKGIESLGYGKGYTAAQETWIRLLKRLEVLRDKRGMAVILLGHSIIRTFKNPSGEDFDHYTLKMHEKSAGVLREWCDDVLFAAQETFAVSKDGGRAKGFTSGDRVIYTTNAASHFAKSRLSVPARLPLDWGAFEDAMASARPEEPATLVARIESMLSEYLTYEPAGEDFVSKVRASVEPSREDAVRLSHLANLLSVRLQEKKEKST